MIKPARVCDVCEKNSSMNLNDGNRFNYDVTGGKLQYDGADICVTCRNANEELLFLLRNGQFIGFVKLREKEDENN